MLILLNFQSSSSSFTDHISTMLKVTIISDAIHEHWHFFLPMLLYVHSTMVVILNTYSKPWNPFPIIQSYHTLTNCQVSTSRFFFFMTTWIFQFSFPLSSNPSLSIISALSKIMRPSLYLWLSSVANSYIQPNFSSQFLQNTSLTMCLPVIIMRSCTSL